MKPTEMWPDPGPEPPNPGATPPAGTMDDFSKESEQRFREWGDAYETWRLWSVECRNHVLAAAMEKITVDNADHKLAAVETAVIVLAKGTLEQGPEYYVSDPSTLRDLPKARARWEAICKRLGWPALS